MAINIFGPETKDSIRVGYISPQDGLVGDVTICEANQIAKSNPGTQFVLRSRDKIRYLNINEVNNLTPKDIKSEKGCPGINLDVKCGPPRVNFYGGGGVGAKANAVIGKDGSVLAIDVISKGYGYKYPPIVEISDNCGLGNGAVVLATLEEQPETLEVFGDNELETYQICPPTDPGYGQLYGANGKAVGSWDPRLYINSAENRNQLEIKKYQDLLEQIKNPWFTTRKNLPDQTLYPDIKNLYDNDKKQSIDTARYISFSDRAYQITKGDFDKFLGDFGISPIPTSKYKATDYAGVPFTLEWDVDFPFDGEYTFYGLSNPGVKSELFIDNKKEKDIPNTKGSNPLLIKKKIKKGIHKVRIDLSNQQKFKLPEQRRVLPVDLTQPQQPQSSKVYLCHAGGGLGGLSNGRDQKTGGKVIVGKGGNGGASSASNVFSDSSGAVTANFGGGSGLKDGGISPQVNTTGNIRFRYVNNQFLSTGVNLDGLPSTAPSGRELIVYGASSANQSIKRKKVIGAYGAGGHGFVSSYTSSGYLGGNQTSQARIYGASDGGGGAVRIKYNGKKQDFVIPGTHEFLVPKDVTTIDIVCIGGGGSGHGGYWDYYRFQRGGGGSGGAYSYVESVKVTPGSKLKVVVGGGGIAPITSFKIKPGVAGAGGPVFSSSLTSENGGDSYVFFQKTTSAESSVKASDKINTKSIASTNTSSPQQKSIFNTIDYINRATPTLWRSNPVTSGPNNVFLNKYGVTNTNPSIPIDLTYKLNYNVIWTNINIPDEELIFEVMGAGSVELQLIDKKNNSKFSFLTSVAGGNSSTNFLGEKIKKVQKIPAGIYDINVIVNSSAEEGKRHRSAFAVNITTKPNDKLLTEPKSWEENPIAIALKIDAPPPPPFKPSPQPQQNRCANNPTWSTRFSNSKKKWWIANSAGPRNDKNSWGAFMNQYAISPVAPFTSSPADNGSVVYQNEWEFEVTQPGYHALLAAVDSSGEIYIDDKLVMTSSATGGPGLSPTSQRVGGGFTLPPATNNANANGSNSKPSGTSGANAGAVPITKTIVPKISLPVNVVGIVTVTLPPGPDGKKPSPIKQMYSLGDVPPNVSSDSILGISTANLEFNYYNVYGNAENKNPEVTWSFKNLPQSISIESYRILLQDLSSLDLPQGKLKTHWDITVPAAITTIPAGVTDPKVIWGENGKPIIGKTYLGDDPKEGVSPIGYAGPQPQTNKVHTYLLTVIANLIGSNDKLSVGQYFTIDRSTQSSPYELPRLKAILNPPKEQAKFITSPYSNNNTISYTPNKSDFEFYNDQLQIVPSTDFANAFRSGELNDSFLYNQIVGNYPGKEGVDVGTYSGGVLTSGEPLNRNPRVKWSFGPPPDGVEVENYEVLLECISGTHAGRIHWNLKVKPGITEIPFNADDGWKNANAVDSQILPNYTGETSWSPSTVGISSVGYSGPQPLRNESVLYRLSVTANLKGSIIDGSPTKVTKAMRFSFVNFSGTKQIPITEVNPDFTPKNSDNLKITYQPTKAVNSVTIPSNLFTLEVTPPESSDKKSSTVAFDNNSDKNLAPITMIGNVPKDFNSNQYVNAENKNPKVEWKVEFPDNVGDFVKVKDYEIILEDLDEPGKNDEKNKNTFLPRVHWSILVPKNENRIPTPNESDMATFVQNNNIQVRDNYSSDRANKDGISPIGYSGPQPPRTESHRYKLSLIVNLEGSESKLIKSVVFKYPQVATEEQYPGYAGENKNKRPKEFIPVIPGTSINLDVPNLLIKSVTAIPEALQDPFATPPTPEIVDETIKKETQIIPVKSKTESKETSSDQNQRNISFKVRTYLNTKLADLNKKIQTSKNEKEKDQFKSQREVVTDLLSAANALVLSTDNKNLSLIPIIEDRINQTQTNKNNSKSTLKPYYEATSKEIISIENPPPKSPPASTPPAPSNQSQKTPTIISTPLPDPKVPGRIFNSKENNPEPKKILLTKGKHKIRVEIKNNQPDKPSNVQETRIFSTKDWLSKINATPKTVLTSGSAKANVGYYREGSNYFVKVDGEGADVIVDFSFYASGDNNGIGSGVGFTKLTIETEEGPKSFDRKKVLSDYNTYTLNSCKFKAGKKYKITFDGRGYILSGNEWIPYYRTQEPTISPSKKSLVIPDGTIEVINGKIYDQGRLTTFTAESYGLNLFVKEVIAPTIKTTVIENIGAIYSGATKDGVTYTGPTPIANYRKDFISPLLKDVNETPNEEIQGKTWKFIWSKVNFPVNGEYILNVEADATLIVRVDGLKVGEIKQSEGRKKINFSTTKGRKTVELELSNNRIPNTGFNTGNPTIAFAEITRIIRDDRNVSGDYWSDNPIGISAVLIPPPCPKKIRGKGTVAPNPPVLEGGNGYKDPNPEIPPTVPPEVPPTVPPEVPPTVPPEVPPEVPLIGPPTVPTYPVAIISTAVITGSGINYNCREDQIFVNDISVPFECDTFGRITNIDLSTLPPVVAYPTIRIQTETGIGLDFTVQFQVIRDPVDVPPQQLLQVTDLVGLKQTGYINGRPYYGSVFYENGTPYAGLYKTPGPLIQVYNTLQESIDAQVTTPPSAILRSGTDVSSNNPRLNIPGTPENLV